MYNLCFLSKLTSSEWASWVQAIGSIIAIVASFILVNSQHNKQKKLLTEQKKEDQRDLIENIIMLAEKSASLITTLMERIRAPQLIHSSDTTVSNQIQERFELDEIQQYIKTISILIANLQIFYR